MARQMVIAWALLTMVFCVSARGDGLATLDVMEPGEWQTLETGVTLRNPSTGTGPWSWWHDLGGTLGLFSLEFYWLDVDPTKTIAEEYGLVDFEVLTDGPVWMLVNSLIGGGGAPGSWSAEVTDSTELAAAGWVQIASDVIVEEGYAPFGENPLLAPFLLYERQCIAGEIFSMRTHKYDPPILFAGVPEPGALGVLGVGGLVMLRRERLRYRHA